MAERGKRETLRTVVKTVCLLAVGALWAQVVGLLVSLPDLAAFLILVIVILVCLLVLV